MNKSKYARSKSPLSFSLGRYSIREMSHSKESEKDNLYLESIKNVILGEGSWAKRLIRAKALIDSQPQSKYTVSTLKDIGEIVKANYYLSKNHSTSEEYISFFSRIETLEASPLESSLSEIESPSGAQETIPPTYKFSPEPPTGIFHIWAEKGIIPSASTVRGHLLRDNINALLAFAIAPEACFGAYENYKKEEELKKYRTRRPIGARFLNAGIKVAAVLGLAASIAPLLSIAPLPHSTINASTENQSSNIVAAHSAPAYRDLAPNLNH